MKPQLRLMATLVALLSLCVGANAQTISLVKDIYTGSDSGYPDEMTIYNDEAYFYAVDAANGGELWKTDGTEAGTVLVKDLRPGSLGSDPAHFVVFNGELYFAATDNTNGRELWKSDGTAAGTVLLSDIYPGTSWSNPSELTVVDTTLFFIATNGTNGVELWKTDGTAAGTVMVKDIRSGSGTSFLSNLTAMGSKLFFYADDGFTGGELWTSDGTAAGTTIVADIEPGFAPSAPDLLTVVDGLLFYRAYSAALGYELYSSDGTALGTQMVKDIYPGTNGSSPIQMAAFDGQLFFRADNGTDGVELWKSDGTEAGTQMVVDIAPGTDHSFPAYLTELDGELFFYATTATYGGELWKSDGTAAGTMMVKDLNPGTGSTNPSQLFEFNNKLFYCAFNPGFGYEIHVSDGTDTGTFMIVDLAAGFPHGGLPPVAFTALGDQLLFRGNNGTTGQELFSLIDPPAVIPFTPDASLYSGSDDCSNVLPSNTPIHPYWGDQSLYNFRSYDINCRSVDMSTIGYSREVGEPVPACGDAVSPTSWYEFTAPVCSDLNISISTDNLGTDFDTWLAVYSTTTIGCDFGAYTVVACSDNDAGGCGGGTTDGSTVDLTGLLNPGETYYIQVGGIGGASGTALMNLSIYPDAPSINAGANPYTQLDVNWTNHSADNYDLFFSPVGSSGYGVRWNRTGTTETLSSLSPGTNYEVWLRNECLPAGAEYYYTRADSQATDELICPSPSPLLCNSATSNSITFNWVEAPGMTNYHVYYRALGASGYSVRWNRPGGTYTITGLMPGTNYQIWVAADCGGGVRVASPYLYCSTAGAASRLIGDDDGASLTYNGTEYVNYPYNQLNLELGIQQDCNVDWANGELNIYDGNGSELSLNQQRQEFDFSLVPSLSNTTTSINTLLQNSGQLNISLIDQQGKVLMSESLTAEAGSFNYQVEVSQYAAGIYYVRLQQGEQQTYQKLVVLK